MPIFRNIVITLALLFASLTATAQSAMRQFEQVASRSSRIDTLQDIARKWPVRVYEPWNSAVGREQLTQLRKVQKKYANRVPETPEELEEVVDAVAPFLRYLHLYGLHYSPHTAVVAPNGTTSIEIDSYCLDAGLPSPPPGEPLRLVKNGNLFPRDVQPIYRSLMRLNAREESTSIQGLLWTLRKINDGDASLHQLGEADIAVLERAHPGATRILMRVYLPDSVLPKIGGRRVRNAGDFLQGIAQERLSNLLGQHGVDWQPGDSVESMLARMSGMRAEGRADPENAYTELAPGVIARGINIQGHSRFGVDIVNTSANPYVFDIADYIAQPSRRAQRLAFGRAHNLLSPTAMDEAGRRQALDALMSSPEGWHRREDASRECKILPDLSDITAVYDAIPILSEFLSAWTLVTGKNPMTGKRATVSELSFAAVNLATVPFSIIKGIARGTKITMLLAKAIDGMRVKPTPHELMIALGMGKLTDFGSKTEAGCSLSEMMTAPALAAAPSSKPPSPLTTEIDRIATDKSFWECPTAASAQSNRRVQNKATLAEEFHASYCRILPSE